MSSKLHCRLLSLALALSVSGNTLFAQDSVPLAKAFQMHPGIAREEVIERTLAPYNGESTRGVDTSDLKGKDEVDEATAIFKCTNTPPVGGSQFLDYEGLPTDHYLWLVGQGGRLIRGEIEASESLPERP